MLLVCYVNDVELLAALVSIRVSPLTCVRYSEVF